jgi:hypothetical protein
LGQCSFGRKVIGRLIFTGTGNCTADISGSEENGLPIFFKFPLTFGRLYKKGTAGLQTFKIKNFPRPQAGTACGKSGFAKEAKVDDQRLIYELRHGFSHLAHLFLLLACHRFRQGGRHLEQLYQG